MTDKKWIEDVEFLNYLKDRFTDFFYKPLLPSVITMTNGDKYYGIFVLKDLVELECSKVYMLDANVSVRKYSYKLNTSNIVSIKYSEVLYINALTSYELEGGDFSNIEDEKILLFFDLLYLSLYLYYFL